MYQGIAKNGARFTVKNWSAFVLSNKELALQVIFNEVLIHNGKEIQLV